MEAWIVQQHNACSAVPVNHWLDWLEKCSQLSCCFTWRSWWNWVAQLYIWGWPSDPRGGPLKGPIQRVAFTSIPQSLCGRNPAVQCLNSPLAPHPQGWEEVYCSNKAAEEIPGRLWVTDCGSLHWLWKSPLTVIFLNYSPPLVFMEIGSLGCQNPRRLKSLI